jgi:RecB family exonuclease
VLPGSASVEGTAAWEADDLAWIEALHSMTARTGAGGRALGVTVRLPRLLALPGDVEDPMAPIADALERRWASLPDAPEIAWDDGRAGEPVEAVTFARGREAEARVAARAVLDALAQGVAPEAVAVVVPALDETALEPLRAALEAAAVPFCEPRGRPALASPEARAALALLALAEGPVTRDLLVELLRAPGLHPGFWTETASETAAAARAAQLAHRLRDLPVAVDRTGRLFAQSMVRVTSARGPDAWMGRALERMLGSATWLREAGSQKELLRRYLELLDLLRLGRPSAAELSSALRLSGAAGRLSLAGLGSGSAAVRAVREAVAELAEAAELLGDGARRAAPAELAAELERATNAASTQAAAARAGAVRIARASDLCGLEHELLVVTGLTARAYGGSDASADAMLDEATSAALPAPCRPPGARDRSSWQMAELCWALAGARRVRLTSSPEDERDESAPPHPLARAAARRLGATREPASRLSPRASVLGGRGVELARLASGAAPSPDIAAKVAAERERTRFFLDPRVAAGPFSGRAAPIDDVGREQLIACVGGGTADRTVPVTAIERAAGCAFAGFARRVLRVRRSEDLAEAADPRERGNLVHRALRAGFEAAAPLSTDPPRAVIAGRAAAERALGLGEAATPLRREAAAQAVADAMRVLWRALADRDDRLHFALAERRFAAGEPAPWGPLELAVAGEPSLFVDGQIDRIDRSTDRLAARVIDYKTGKAPDPAEYGRTALQLPLYAEVVARAFETPTVDGLYLRVRAGGGVEERPRKADDRVLDGPRRAESVATARRAVLALWRGELAPRPRSAALCPRCEARDVCRRPAVMPVDDDEDRS